MDWHLFGCRVMDDVPSWNARIGSAAVWGIERSHYDDMID